MTGLLLLSAALAGTLCNDGWISSSSGSGTCSHHGGIAQRGVGPSTPAPATISGWKLSSAVTNSGGVYFSLTNNEPSMSVSIDCYAYAVVGWSFNIYLFSSSGGPLAGAMDHRHDSADGTTPLNVFARRGDISERIVSWDVSVSDGPGGGGPIVLEKKMNLQAAHQAGGVLFLTEADLATIEKADSIYVSVYVGEMITANLQTFQMDMSGLRGKLPALRQRCKAASVQAATTNKETK